MVRIIGPHGPMSRENFEGKVTRFVLVDSDQAQHEAYGMELTGGGRIVFVDWNYRVSKPRGIEKKVGHVYRLDGIRYWSDGLRTYSEDNSRSVGFPGWERKVEWTKEQKEKSHGYFQIVEPRRFRPVP